jgi:HSP20 family protein
MAHQWNPLHDLMLLQDRMNRLFEDATQRRARGETEAGDEMERADWQPAADVYEEEGEYIIAVDLPGIDRSALDISVDENRLTIKGSRAKNNRAKARSERPEGRFIRTFTVPGSVDQGAIRAEFKDGVLQVHLPRRQEPKGHRVEIKVS